MKSKRRALHDHIIKHANDTLTVCSIDEPGHGGAHHAYLVEGFDNTANPSDVDDLDANQCLILFQNGPIPEVGVNGITNEALLAIVADRLRSFQKGPYPCTENSFALESIEKALAWLKYRTTKRILRGVEGTHHG